jgi:hypothetical protein
MSFGTRVGRCPILSQVTAKQYPSRRGVGAGQGLRQAVDCKKEERRIEEDKNMKTVSMAWVAFGTVVLLAAAAQKAGAAPAPVLKSTEAWEYAEMYPSILSGRRGGGGFGNGGNAGPGGGPAPFQPAQAPVARTVVRWVTADGEIDAASWEDLAGKLKAPAAKPGATPLAHKLRVLNHLGSQGWELVSTGTSTTSGWIFKRRTSK